MTNKLIHVSALFLASGLLWACSFGLHPPTSEQINDVVKNQPGVNPDVVQMGFQVYIDKCSQCHKLYKPGKYVQSEWEKDILPKESKKAKLSDEELMQIKTYIYAFSKDKQNN